MEISSHTLYTTKELAEILKMNRDVILKKIREDKITAINTGTQEKPNYRILGKDILKYLKENVTIK